MEKPITREKLIADIQAFCLENSISATAFGINALNDSAFFGRLKEGKSPTLERIEKVYDYMSRFVQNESVHKANIGGADELLS